MTTALRRRAARTLHVVTQRRWMVDELTAGLTGHGWTVQAHHGLSALPGHVGVDPEHVLWAPGAFAARQMLANPELRLSAPGTRWLPSIRPDVLGRTVELCSAHDASTAPLEGFWKLAETKWDSFDARWRTTDVLVADLAAAHLPGDSDLHYTATRLRITHEHRVVIDHGHATTTSCYLDNHGRDRSDLAFGPPAATVDPGWVEEIVRTFPAGSAFAVDIGMTPGDWTVIEANPIWSSVWYGCDLPSFADAVAAAQGPDVPDTHLWRPDAVLARRAHRMGSLPVDEEIPADRRSPAGHR